MRQSSQRPGVVILTVFILSAPLIAMGSVSRARLLPGLPLSALMFLTVGLAGMGAAYRSGRWRGVGALLARVGDWRRVRPRSWMLVGALLMPAVLVVEYFTMRLLDLPLPTPSIDWLMAPVLFALFFAAAAFEEITWTGVLLEPLAKTHGALLAAVIIGSSWALLHIVPYVQAGNTAYWVLGQCLFSIAFRVVLVCLYQVSGGALFVVVLCHASYNTAWQLFPNQGSAYDPVIAALLTTIVAIIAVWVFGARTLAGRHLTRASS